jgi:hypothetical protein
LGKTLRELIGCDAAPSPGFGADFMGIRLSIPFINLRGRFGKIVTLASYPFEFESDKGW